MNAHSTPSALPSTEVMKLPLLFTSIAVLLLLTSTSATGFTADHVAGAASGVRMRSRRVEDLSLALDLEEEAAYPHRRVLQAGGHITNKALDASRPACNGPCPGRGGGYTPGRGCNPFYGCHV